jgi:PKD repeat protein
MFLKRALLAGLVLFSLQMRVEAAGTFIPAGSRADIVHDAQRDTLYISSGAQILRYRLATSSFLAPWSIGGNLRGMDLSPDGNMLAVADETRTDSSVWIWLIDLSTGAADRISFPRAFEEGGTWSVAYGNDGAVLVTGTFEGSGFVPLRRYDPATGATTVVPVPPFHGEITQNSMLTASGDATHVGFEQSNSSDGPFGRYRVADGDIISKALSAGTGLFNFEIGVNRDGTQYAIVSEWGCVIADSTLAKTRTLGGFRTGPIGVAYHPVEPTVYFSWATTSEVRAFDTNTYGQIATYEAESAFNGPFYYGYERGRLKTSRDGSLLFVTVDGGVRYFRLYDPLVAVDRAAVTTQNVSVPVVLSGTVGNGGTLSYSILAEPAHGVLTGTAPDLIYTPESGYSGPDGFTYAAVYGRATAPATVSITVRPTAGGEPPIADAGGPYAVNGRRTVQFDGSRSSDPESDPIVYSWSFGDGASASGPLVSHLYNTPGTYTVVLSVTDGVSTTTDVTTAIVSNAAPVASAGGPYSGARNQLIAFSANAGDADGDTLAFSWEFGDGSLGAGRTASHAYTTDGTYDVVLRVSDGYATTTATTTATVANRPPVIVSAGGPYKAPVGRLVTFTTTANDPDGTLLQYSYRFGDGWIGGGGATITHAYALPGVYTFTVTVTDGTDSVSATSSVTIMSGERVVFSDKADGGTAQWTVAGSDGVGGPALWHVSSHRSKSPSSAFYYGRDATLTYDTGARNYGTLTTRPIDLTRRVNSWLNFHHFLRTQNVNDRDQARVEVSGDGGASWQVVYSTPFNNTGGDMREFGWDLAAYDGRVIQVRFGFDTIDNQSNGHEGWVVDDVVVSAINRAPTANPGGPYTGGRTVPIVFNGSASVDPDGDGLSYAWNFGDGTTGTGPSPTHTYAALGTYTVRLVVNDGMTSSPMVTTTVTIENQAPIANAGGPYSGVRTAPVMLNGSASTDPEGAALSYAWDFGDGTTGTGVSPVHTYAALGTYTASLVVNDGLVSSPVVTTTVVIQNQPPNANAGGPYIGGRTTPVAFNGTASTDPDGDALSYAWNFGDGATGTGPAPAHTYAALGAYTVTLVVSDGVTSSAPSTTTVMIQNVAPTANAGVDLTVKHKTSVTLNGLASSDADGAIAAYAWRQVSGTPASLTGANTARPRFTAPKVTNSPLTLTFELKVTDSDGATAVDQVRITVTK